MTVENIITGLKEAGYTNVEKNIVVKNGVEKIGITIRDKDFSPIAPVIYVDGFLDCEDVDAVVQTIINIYESNKTANINISQFTDMDWVESHLYIALQKTSSEDGLVKKPTAFDGIEQYLYLRDRMPDCSGYSVKVNESLVRNLDISIEELWDIAEKNTFAVGETTINSMASVLASMGFPEIDEMPFGVPNIYVVSNTVNEKGASAVLDTKALHKFGEEMGIHRAVVIFSSRHEILLIGVEDEEIDLDDCTDLSLYENMCREINETTVDEIDQLPSKCYIINL